MPVRHVGKATCLAAALLLAGVPARSEPEKCRFAIAAAAASFRATKLRAVAACKEKIARGKLAAGTDCNTEAKPAAAIARAVAKLEKRIATACGGRDKTCGTGDDDPLAEAGWTEPLCPAFAGCGSFATEDCGGVAGCVRCLGEATAGETLDTTWDLLPHTDPKAQKELNRCQLALGRAIEALATGRTRLLARCWAQFGRGRIAGPCPDADTEQDIGALELALEKNVCRACGGSDRACGGGDDVALEDVGPTQCPDIADCTGGGNGALASIEDLAGCLGCVASHDATCADTSVLPGLAVYPEACKPVTTLQPNGIPLYGSSEITAGFDPNLQLLVVGAGGPIDVSYLGGGCTGYTTARPMFNLTYNSGAAPLLRFYILAGIDSTLVIRKPDGSYVCNDDSFGGANPTLAFDAPVSGGLYQVWGGSKSLGSSPVDLYFTETPGNHP